jgi:hypothetical protein
LTSATNDHALSTALKGITQAADRDLSERRTVAASLLARGDCRNALQYAQTQRDMDLVAKIQRICAAQSR